MAKNTIINGAFSDAEGNAVSNGILILEISQDAALTNAQGFLCSGIPLFISLDANGNVVSNISIWPTDQMLPSGITYRAWVENANGAIVWGPNSETVSTSPSPFDLSNWTP
jgi:hypothetical protein